MKILVLGGSGFVGTRLIEMLLADGHDVINGDLVSGEKYPHLWKLCDVCDDKQLSEAMQERELVINLAAAHRDDVRPLSLYTRTNVTGAEHVTRMASKTGIKHIVFTSSVAVYGFPRIECVEDSPKFPFNEYGRTKLAAEKVYEDWQRSSPGNILTVVRPTVIFGEGNRGNVYNLFCQLASRRFIMVGNGKNKKSMAYVGNVAAFLKWNIENNRQPYSVFNYVDKPDFSMNELLDRFEKILRDGSRTPLRFPYWFGMMGGFGFDLLAAVTRRQLPISSIRIKKFCAQTVFNADKAHSCGFKPPYTLETALERVILFEFKKDH